MCCAGNPWIARTRTRKSNISAVSCKIVKYIFLTDEANQFFNKILSNPKKFFSKLLRLLGNLMLMQYIVVQYLGSHVLVVLFVCVFCDSFLCSISLLLLSDSLSCVLNSVL